MLGLGSTTTTASSFLDAVPFLVMPEGPGLGLVGGPAGGGGGTPVFVGVGPVGDLPGFGFVVVVGGLGLLVVLLASLF